MAVHVLGIRHHGPGSARSVLAALDEIEPDALVIEGAPELDDVAALAADPAMTPPVAGLVHDTAEPRRATFYPLASFSPEWVALRWALDRGVPVRFADLRASHVFAIAARAEAEREQSEREQAGRAAAGSGPTGDEHPEPADASEVVEHGTGGPGEQPQPGSTGATSGDELDRQDPVGLLARAAGYDDPERWWEDAVELRSGSATERFAHLLAAMREVRAARPGLDDEENQRREAAMRLILREVMAGHENVAVVCGAFHAPALVPDTSPSKAADTRLLKGLPKVTVAATWAPWTTQRLSLASGYGAGVQAPGWYQHLFTSPPDDVVTGWLVGVAHALRRQRLDAAPASVVEAVRLAGTLAAVRGRPCAGLAEVEDAAVTVLCEGSPERYSVVREEVLVGSVLGAVPEGTPIVPLAADLQRQQKALRLAQSAAVKETVLDLRRPNGLARSVLFHRLLLLGIDWATPARTARTTGTFKEVWHLQWLPELAVAVVDAARYGSTVEQAAAARVADRAADADLPGLSRLVEECLVADLPEALGAVVARLEQRTAQGHDIRALMGAVEPLARTVRYGDVRGLDTASLLALVRVLVARIGAGLAAGCASLDDGLAAATRGGIDAVQRAVALLDLPDLRTAWTEALVRLGEGRVHGGVAGRVDRILLDGGAVERDVVLTRMSRRLSLAHPADDGAWWLDSFLGDEAVLLLADAELLALVDEWLAGTPASTFDDLLPLLRRTFARFGAAERRRLGDALAHRGGGGPAVSSDVPDLDRARPAVAAVARLLGLEVPA